MTRRITRGRYNALHRKVLPGVTGSYYTCLTAKERDEIDLFEYNDRYKGAHHRAVCKHCGGVYVIPRRTRSFVAGPVIICFTCGLCGKSCTDALRLHVGDYHNDEPGEDLFLEPSDPRAHDPVHDDDDWRHA